MSEITVKMSEEEFIEWSKFKNLDKNAPKTIFFKSYMPALSFSTFFKPSVSEKYDCLTVNKYCIIQDDSSLDSYFKNEINAYNSVIDGLKEEIKKLETKHSEFREYMVNSYNIVVRFYNNSRWFFQDTILEADLLPNSDIIIQNIGKK